jgi:hypothetical protein
MHGCEFVARLLQHVLPAGFKRVRHYGLLAAPVKAAALAHARQLLHMPQPNPLAAEDAQAFMRRVAAVEIGRCPHCAQGRWQLVCERQANPRLLFAAPPLGCRGPPP